MFQRVSFPTLLVTWLTALTLCMLAVIAGGVQAQDLMSRLPKNTHPLLRDTMPPGEVGAIQLARKPELRGVWQAIEIKGPAGMRVSMADAGQFSDDLSQARLAVMVGYPYRMRLTGLPFEEETALYPTLEIIDRIHPPAEREHRFPIPIELDEDDLVDAMRGEMIMKVIYLEDNQIADPVDTAGNPQRVLDLRPSQDALQTADRMGRPVAILRIGSRVPNVSEGQDWDAFLYGCPAWVTLKPIPDKQMLIDQGKWPATANSGSISDRR
ncbi:hypothetical protein SH467x_003097 [Pirellulaceae bacterium SH467]|jgi:hypothetical protein